MKAVFLDADTVDQGDLDLGPLHSLLPELNLHRSTLPHQVRGRIEDCTIVLLNKVRLDRDLLQCCSQLRLVCVVATGTDNIDLDAASELGIRVCNIRAYCSASVTQHVFGMILQLTQFLPEHDRLARGGDWQNHSQFCMLRYPVRELSGLNMGIVGLGELGRSVASTARAFGMRVATSRRSEADRREGRVSLRDLLRQSDVLSLHCPLTPETHHLIGKRELALMKPDALLVNTSRGALVEPAALAQALRSGKLGGAGIDVLEQEPPAAGNPLLDPTLPRLILTPHVAWSARQARQRAVDETLQNIRAFLAGRPRHLVN